MAVFEKCVPEFYSRKKWIGTSSLGKKMGKITGKKQVIGHDHA